MVISLVKGQKIDITKNKPETTRLHIGMGWKSQHHFDIDVSAFMLGEDEKIIREEDFVFYGQPYSSNKSVQLETSISSVEKQHFLIDLLKVPTVVKKIAFTLTIYESELNGHTFEAVSDIVLRIVDSRKQEEMAAFPIDYSFTKESAIVLGSLYRYGDQWKFHAVGAGFFGGLADLCKEYGVEVDDQPTDTNTQVETTTVSSLPNERFQVVQERDAAVSGEEIPKQPAEPIHLKRESGVQFDEQRIETLSQRNDDLISLFADKDEDTASRSTGDSSETVHTLPTFLDDSQEEDYDSFIQSLTDVERAFLVKFDGGSISLDLAKSFLKQKGLMVALFINGINEKAFEHLGDNLLEVQANSIVVFDEFHSLVLSMKERANHEH
ncbi:TerD family protein [Cytobacillus praedii]|uniref:TerD family protein n=1 Tax=Cytobacillus praedii TaxID=1742358 RepID=UPI00070A0BBD|nr:TerD family protein [Cytobacillus praedii]